MTISISISKPLFSFFNQVKRAAMMVLILLLMVAIAEVHGLRPTEYTLHTDRGTIVGTKYKINGKQLTRFLGKTNITLNWFIFLFPLRLYGTVSSK